jgi:hypothetical protein
MSRHGRFVQLSSVLVVASTAVTAAAGSVAQAGSLAPATSVMAHEEASALRGVPNPVGLSESRDPVTRPDAPLEGLGLRTDRLSAQQRERWQSIVGLVFAEDDLGRPLHPTLRKMWDQVAASSHEVHVELAEPTLSVHATAGLFRIESVRPDGNVVATVRLNLKTIDRARVGDAAHHGFRRFHGLGREGRYAEVLGHELGHAVWTLADPARGRHQLALRTRQEGLARALLKAEPDARAEIRGRMKEVGEQIEALEMPARAAEARVWRELLASQAARGVQNASSSTPELGTNSSRLLAGEVE